MFKSSRQPQPSPADAVESADTSDAPQEETMSESQPAVSKEQASTSAEINELERLRDILYGNQTRQTEKRLGELEVRVETTRRELLDMLNENMANLSDAMQARLSKVRKDLTERVDRLAVDHAAQLKTVRQELTERADASDARHEARFTALQREFSERLDRQNNEHNEQLRAAIQEFTAKLDSQHVELLAQIRDTYKELSERIDRVDTTQSERLRTLQSETRQRDESLRQELLGLAASLEEHKVSRQELGHALLELGQRLQSAPAE